MGRKHKKHKKIKQDKKSAKYSGSSSESESSSEEEWIEKDISKGKSNEKNNTVERDEWMSIPSLFPSVSREQIRQERDKEKEDKKSILDEPGQTDRELNPYWKNGGIGLPQHEKLQSVDSLCLAKTTVGDQGVYWLKKALLRAKEQADVEGRRLEDVVAERWGSLEKLQSMIVEAENREKGTKEKSKRSSGNMRKGEMEIKYKRHNRQRDSMDKYSDKGSDWEEKEKNERRKQETYKKDYDRRDKDINFEHNKYKYYDKKDEVYEQRSNKKGKHHDSNNKRSDKDFDRNKGYKRDKFSVVESRSKRFIKPGEGDDIPESKSLAYSVPSTSSKGWQKKEFKETVQTSVEEKKYSFETKYKAEDVIESSRMEIINKEGDDQVLTDEEMNALAAKVMKAELMGNTVLASELQMKLENARQTRLKYPNGIRKNEEETVILTKTDSKGFTQPLTIEGKHLEPSGGRRKGVKMETHKDGKRMRYFADDDQYSLQEMFQREKLNTVEDQNEIFAKLSSKGVGKDGSARDMDDIFEETARFKVSEGKTQAKERDRAIKEHKHRERALDNCEWCLDSKLMSRHLIVAIGNKCYLCLPPYQSLTEGHCLIVPTFHTASATLLDEDVWEEIQVFRKSLTIMFKTQEKDVVFFESSMHLKRMPHMVLNCVPMPKETGDMAPVYFKKAIMESEMEWSSNKKLVDLHGKDVRRAIPKGLPYFAVDFGLEAGYAHVIEDEKLFPQNFGQEIIGGMLDLDHSLWRKPRKEKLDQQTKKVVEFTKIWKSFDCTKTK